MHISSSSGLSWHFFSNPRIFHLSTTLTSRDIASTSALIVDSPNAIDRHPTTSNRIEPQIFQLCTFKTGEIATMFCKLELMTISDLAENNSNLFITWLQCNVISLLSSNQPLQNICNYVHGIGDEHSTHMLTAAEGDVRYLIEPDWSNSLANRWMIDRRNTLPRPKRSLLGTQFMGNFVIKVLIHARPTARWEIYMKVCSQKYISSCGHPREFGVSAMF